MKKKIAMGNLRDVEIFWTLLNCRFLQIPFIHWFFSQKIKTRNNVFFPLKYRCFRVSCMFFPWTNPMSEWYGFVWNRVSHFFHCLIIIIPSWSLFNGHIDWWVTPPSIPFLYTLYICQFVNCIPPIFGGLKSYLIEPHKWPSTGVPEYDGGVWSPKKRKSD